MHLLLKHREEVDSVFKLLGTDENDITSGLGWVLIKNIHLLKAMIEKIAKVDLDYSDTTIRLQEYGKDRGYTDIEIDIDNSLFWIIEAKKGWDLPDETQLKKYASRFAGSKQTDNRVVVISECSKEYAMKQLEKYELNINIDYLSWQQVYRLLKEVYGKSNHSQKRLLKEFDSYLRGAITMQDKDSNMVFCVVLNHEKVEGSEISYVDVVYKYGHYFYPVRGRWPKDPPNYIAFRYSNMLQSIHYVEEAKIVLWTDMHKYLPVKSEKHDHQYMLLKLGPKIMPNNKVTNGKIYPSQHLNCMLDTLLTSKTIEQARNITRKRLGTE